MKNSFKAEALKSFRRALRYGYFAPLTAAGLVFSRPGGYWMHLTALYRLCFWRGEEFARPLFCQQSRTDVLR